MTDICTFVAMPSRVPSFPVFPITMSGPDTWTAKPAQDRGFAPILHRQLSHNHQDTFWLLCMGVVGVDDGKQVLASASSALPASPLKGEDARVFRLPTSDLRPSTFRPSTVRP